MTAEADRQTLEASLSGEELVVHRGLQDAGVRDPDRFRPFLKDLHKAFYRTLDDFKGATRAGLNQTGLVNVPGLVDTILECQKAAAATTSAGTSAASPVEEYECPAMDFKSMRFDAQLPCPVRLSPLDAQRCPISHVPERLKADIEISGGSVHNLSQYIMVLRQNSKSGTSEDGIHGRDDALLKIINLVGGMESERNKVSSSTIAGSRIDAWLGQPPVVLIEEKANSNGLQTAMEEVRTKFVFTPHYEHVPFVVGIAIAGDLLKVSAIGRQGFLESGGPFDLSTLNGCIQAVRAAINVGRLCKHIRESSLLHDVHAPFNIVQKNDRRSLLITHTHVEKQYHQLSKDMLQTLRAFYAETSDVEYVEHAKRVEQKGTNLLLWLTPVGLERRPGSVWEAKVAIKCILEAAGQCHKRKWVLNDIRWANIILLASGIWTVIDCEYARRVGEPIPKELKVKCDWSDAGSPSTDLYCIGKLLSGLEGLELDQPLLDLQNLLTSKAKNFNKKLTADQVFKHYPWLRQVSPTASPAPSAGKRKRKAVEQEPPDQSAVTGAVKRKKKAVKQEQPPDQSAVAGAVKRKKKAVKQEQPPVQSAVAGVVKRKRKKANMRLVAGAVKGRIRN